MCLTPQYKDPEVIYNKLQDNFVVVGFLQTILG
jgi:glutathione peroxidase-family protein